MSVSPLRNRLGFVVGHFVIQADAVLGDDPNIGILVLVFTEALRTHLGIARPGEKGYVTAPEDDERGEAEENRPGHGKLSSG
jgi:hypothetical protein